VPHGCMFTVQHTSKTNGYLSSNIILGVYLIIFGAGKLYPCTVQTISIG
jgi:hypothetical protein